MNDVLKSLTVLDLAEGLISSISYESTKPIERPEAPPPSIRLSPLENHLVSFRYLSFDVVEIVIPLPCNASAHLF